MGSESWHTLASSTEWDDKADSIDALGASAILRVSKDQTLFLG